MNKRDQGTKPMYKITFSLKPAGTGPEMLLAPTVLMEYDDREIPTTLRKHGDIFVFDDDHCETELTFALRLPAKQSGRLYVNSVTLPDDQPLPASIAPHNWRPSGAECVSGPFTGPALLLHHWILAMPPTMHPKQRTQGAMSTSAPTDDPENTTTSGTIKFKRRPRFNG